MLCQTYVLNNMSNQSNYQEKTVPVTSEDCLGNTMIRYKLMFITTLLKLFSSSHHAWNPDLQEYIQTCSCPTTCSWNNKLASCWCTWPCKRMEPLWPTHYHPLPCHSNYDPHHHVSNHSHPKPPDIPGPGTINIAPIPNHHHVRHYTIACVCWMFDLCFPALGFRYHTAVQST